MIVREALVVSGEVRPLPPWYHARENLAENWDTPKTWEGMAVDGVGG